MAAARSVRRRWLLRWLLLLVLLVLLALLAGWSALRGSLARLDGEVVLAGLSAPATIERDALGTATIEARSVADAMRALGYVHAQERFFEMDLMRRSAAGELAALFGPAALDLDRAARMHRLRDRAALVLADEPPQRRALVEAYVAGVNAGLHDLRVRPWPYLLVRAAPQPWRSEDSVLVVLAMFMDLHDQDNRRELGLAQLARHLDPQLFALLRSDGTAWDAPLFGEPRGMPLLPTMPPAARVPAVAAGTGAPDDEAPGSNNFAVSGALTDDGRALVADDMHLGLGVPNLWFRARLRYPHPQQPERLLDVSGVTLPGVPGVVAGSNGDIAWGFTNSYGDWVDWVEVEWADAAHSRYRTADGEEAAVVHEELIEVAGADPEPLQVVETVWGPVLHDGDAIDDAKDGDGDADSRGATPPALALAWTAHRRGGVDFALIDLVHARSVDEAVAAAQHAGMPAQNLVVGDRDGRIAWTLTGRIPRRTGGCDPQLPLQPTRGCDWDGWVDPAQVPKLVDPANQRLWTANARVLDGAALALVGDGGYALGARQQQIRDGLFAHSRFDEQALLDIQLDDRALFLERWWRLLRETVEDPALADDAAIAELAAASAVWNGRAAVDSASYRLVRAFRLELHDALYDRLVAPAHAAEGEDFAAPRLPQFEGVAWALLEQQPARLPDGSAIDWPALRADAARAVVAAMKQHGDDLSLRTWGERNTAAVRHPLSGALPGWLAGALDMPAEPLPGDTDMPRVQAPAFGASERFVVAPGHETRGLMHLPGGSSGHPLSPFHGAGHADWVQGRATPFLPGPARHRLRLEPAGA